MLNRNRFNFASLLNLLGSLIDVDNSNVSITLDSGYKVIYSPALWRDEYAGAEWLAPNGASAPDKVAVTLGGISRNYYGFDGATTTEQMSNQIEIAHDADIDGLNLGTHKIEFHIHGFTNTASPTGNVRFYVDITYHKPFAQPEAMTPLTINFDLTGTTAQDHLIRGVEVPKPSNNYQVGGIFTFNVRRDPTDAADTHSGEFYLYKFAMHLPITSYGTTTKYSGD